MSRRPPRHRPVPAPVTTTEAPSPRGVRPWVGEKGLAIFQPLPPPSPFSAGIHRRNAPLPALRWGNAAATSKGCPHRQLSDSATVREHRDLPSIGPVSLSHRWQVRSVAWRGHHGPPRALAVTVAGPTTREPGVWWGWRKKIKNTSDRNHPSCPAGQVSLSGVGAARPASGASSVSSPFPLAASPVATLDAAKSGNGLDKGVGGTEVVIAIRVCHVKSS